MFKINIIKTKMKVIQIISSAPSITFEQIQQLDLIFNWLWTLFSGFKLKLIKQPHKYFNISLKTYKS